ncbi:MAG: GTP cyclohydrolase II [Gammaproteobacteria bacterium]
MFSYVDANIKQWLLERDLLVTVNQRGTRVDTDSENALLSILGPVPMPRTIAGQQVTLEWYPFVRRTELGDVLTAADQVRAGQQNALHQLLHSSMSVNSVFALPGLRQAKRPLVRIHSCCLTGDIFGSRRCDCGPQLTAAFEQILAEGSGAVVYMSGHEGRGIGLWAKAITYLLQDEGQDTYQANASLNLPEDSRDFTDAAVVLRYLMGGETVRLLSNNPVKRRHLEQGGQPVAELVPLVAGVNEYNIRYLRAKKEKGHALPDSFESG